MSNDRRALAFVPGRNLRYNPCTSLIPVEGLSMLGHLVFGRYGSGNGEESHETHESHVARSNARWMERLLGALFRRRHH
jgi:hypothetical protein